MGNHVVAFRRWFIYPVIVVLSTSLCMLTGCKSEHELQNLDSIKNELSDYSFREHENLNFMCDPPSVYVDDVYTITMNPSNLDEISEDDRLKLKKATESIYGVNLPIDQIQDFQMKGDDGSLGAKHLRFEIEGYGGESYNKQSTFMLWKDLPDQIILDFNFKDTKRFDAANFPNDVYQMIDNSELSIEDAIKQADNYIAKLNECKMFDDGEGQVLSNVMVANTDYGAIIILHYRQTRSGLEVDDGGSLQYDPGVDQMRNPFFEIMFAGNEYPFNIRNMYSDGVSSIESVRIIPLSSAESILSNSLAPNVPNDVYQVALRYCCVYQQQDVNRIYRPMWCFVLSDSCSSQNIGWSQYFPRITAYVDAIDGTVYYSDSQQFVLGKLGA